MLERAITGRITRAQWIDQVGQVISSPTAAEEWLAAVKRGSIDWEMVDLVDQLRTSGIVVAILTNGTDTIPEELESFKLDGHFDDVFSSASIGFAKPDRRAFEAVCESLDVQPEAVFFTDDSPSKLAGAIELGMTTKTFTGVTSFVQHLSELLPGWQ